MSGMGAPPCRKEVIMHYVATFIPHTDGSGRYDIGFADLPGCASQGNSLDDALNMASEILSFHIGTMLDDGDTLPQPSTPEEAREKDLQFAKEEGFDLAPGTLWQYVVFEPERAEKKVPPVRVNVSLKPSVLSQIDAVANEMGLTRSGAIAVATREYASRMGIVAR